MPGYSRHCFHIPTCMQACDALSNHSYDQPIVKLLWENETTLGATGVFTSSWTAAAATFTSIPANHNQGNPRSSPLLHGHIYNRSTTNIRYVGLTQVIFLIRHLYLSGVWLRMYLRTDSKKTCVSKRLDYVLIRLGSIVNTIREGLYDYLMTSRIFTLIMNKTYIWAPKIMRKTATDNLAINLHDIACFCPSRNIWRNKTVHLRPAYLIRGQKRGPYVVNITANTCIYCSGAHEHPSRD